LGVVPPPFSANREKKVELLKSLGATFIACCFLLFLCAAIAAVPILPPEPPLVEEDADMVDPVDDGGSREKDVEER